VKKSIFVVHILYDENISSIKTFVIIVNQGLVSISKVPNSIDFILFVNKSKNIKLYYRPVYFLLSKLA